MTRLAFLDFDGVLNSERFFVTRPPGTVALDPVAIDLLNGLVARSHARIVISSTWRIGQTLGALRALLGRVGFKGRVVGKTPDYCGHYQAGAWVNPRRRGEEIQAFLDGWTGKPVEAFVILDDESEEEIAPLSHRLVRTSWAEGLTQDHIERSIAMLESQTKNGAGVKAGAARERNEKGTDPR